MGLRLLERHDDHVRVGIWVSGEHSGDLRLKLDEWNELRELVPVDVPTEHLPNQIYDLARLMKASLEREEDQTAESWREIASYAGEMMAHCMRIRNEMVRKLADAS